MKILHRILITATTTSGPQAFNVSFSIQIIKYSNNLIEMIIFIIFLGQKDDKMVQVDFCPIPQLMDLFNHVVVSIVALV